MHSRSAVWIAIVPGAIAYIAILVWAWREYRARAGAWIRVTHDRVRWELPGGSLDAPFAAIEAIQHLPPPLDRYGLLRLRVDGRNWELHGDRWPLPELVSALSSHAGRLLAERARARLEHGEALPFPELGAGTEALQIAGVTLAGLLGGPVGILGAGARLISSGRWRGAMGGGGLIVTRRGVRGLRDGVESEIPWERIDSVQSDDVGLLLGSTRSNQILRLTLAARDFLVLCALLPALVPPGALASLPPVRDST
ncbi:MAG: hypothetical protein HY720_15230 [Planctomycetes bacterium]|nr:hypothetical protein [Planctomycetota bacterium]